MQKIEQWKNGLERDGFLAIGKHIKHIHTHTLGCISKYVLQTVEDLLPVTQLEQYRRLYDDIRSGQVDVSRHRHDLGSHVATGRENICQVQSIILIILFPISYLLHLAPGDVALVVPEPGPDGGDSHPELCPA